MGYNAGKESQLQKGKSIDNQEELRLTSDLAFKAVFGRDRKECKQALIGLLNAILFEDGDRIQTLTYVNPFNPQDSIDDKLTCMDIKLVTESETRISVEMQVVVEPVFINRSIYYEAQLITEELGEGENYSSMNRSIFIGILADNLFAGPRVHREYRLKDVMSGEELSDLMELHFVELDKADQWYKTEKVSEVEKWALYLKYAGQPEHRELVAQLTRESEMIEVAETIRREVSKDEELRARAFSKRLFQMDIVSRLSAAQKEGLKLGMEDGLEQGQRKERLIIAKKMLDQGMAPALISEITGLTVEEIKEIKIG